MISFDHVNHPNWKYSLVFPYIEFVHKLIYYRRFEVVNREKLPPEGEGYLVICNHQNGLNDAMGILYTVGGKRCPVFIARGDLFRKDGLAKFLRFFRIMPAFRKRAGETENMGLNELIFEQSARIIGEGGVVALFPEAAHQHGRYLGSFKKGFARIAFKVAEQSGFQTKLKIVPLAHHYANYFSMQSKLVMTVGDPFEFSELYELYQSDPHRAISLLNEKARSKVQSLAIDCQDHDHYRQYETLRAIACPQERPFTKEQQAGKRFVDALNRLKTDQPQQHEELMSLTQAYEHCLDTLNLRDWLMAGKQGASLLWKLPVALLAALCWLYGLFANCLPLALCKWLTGKVKDRMLHSSVQFAVCTFLLPIWYLLVWGLTWLLSGKAWMALCVLASLYPSVILYARSSLFLKKTWHQLRSVAMRCCRRSSMKQASELRTRIVSLLNKLSL